MEYRSSASGKLIRLRHHRNLYSRTLGKSNRLVVARVRVPRHTNTCIVSQYPVNSLRHLRRAVSHRHLPGVQRVADSYAPAIMKRDPACAGSRIEQRVKDRTVCNRIAAVFHCFSLAERRSDGAAVKMIAAYDNRRFQFAFCHQVVQPIAEKRALPVTQPADTCRPG